MDMARLMKGAATVGASDLHLRVNGTPMVRVNGQMRPLDPGNIRLQKGLAGGSLLDVGCYPVYGIRWALGLEPVRVFARAVEKFGVDVEMTGQLAFGHQMASFDCGFTMPQRGWMDRFADRHPYRDTATRGQLCG